jgi:hypothetical protein
MRMPIFYIILLIIGVTAVLALSIDRRSGEADAGHKITTEQAAAAAGARVLPTEPRLRIEPK